MKTLLIIIMTTLWTVNLFAQEIVTYPGEDQSLEKRWQWAAEKANKDGLGKYWVAYTFENLMHANSYVGHFSRHYKDKEKLGELLYPGSPKDYFESLNYKGRSKKAKKVLKELALLFRFNKDEIRETEVSSIDLHFDLDDMPVLWLGLATKEESIKLIMDKYKEIEYPEGRESLISAAGMHKEFIESFNFLKNIITDEKDNELREDAVFWLGQQDNPDAIPFLVKTAQSDISEDVAEKAVFALHTMESDEAADAIIDLTRSAKNHEVREKAVFWLGQMASKKAVAALDDIVYSDEQTALQKKAVFALSQLDDGKGVPKLIKIAKTHPNAQIRKKAIFWLGESEDDRALEALIDMVQN